MNYVTNVPIPAFLFSELCLHGAMSLISHPWFLFLPIPVIQATLYGLGTPRIWVLALWRNGIENGAEDMQKLRCCREFSEDRCAE